MKKFDKKLLIIACFLILIVCMAIYFFTKEDDFENISVNEVYFSPQVTEVPEKIIIHIDGEVINPGLVYLPTESRISDAIEAAGGKTELANITSINLAYPLKDGQKIYIPSIYDIDNVSVIQNDAGQNVIMNDSSSSSNIININTATKAELETLNGIGSSTASKIIDYRTKNGKFTKIEDLMNVSGIGENKFNAIKDFICI